MLELKELANLTNRFIGVADIASVRFSLPAQLLEPTPNLGMCLQSEQEQTLETMMDRHSDSV